MAENLSKENIRLTNLECRVLKPEDSTALGRFFTKVVGNADDKLFHPHGFGYVDADNICNHQGKDLYYGVFSGDDILGYGMLRGWSDGYDVPSLGIVISWKVRGLGLGKMFMSFLHSAERNRGAKSIRLTVLKENVVAKSLYESLGYTFSESGDSFVGELVFNRRPSCTTGNSK